jgi:MFS family permease
VPAALRPPVLTPHPGFTLSLWRRSAADRARAYNVQRRGPRAALDQIGTKPPAARWHHAAVSTPASRESFAALRHRGYRFYFFGTAAAMMADNIEHVVSYWVVFQEFQSPALGGYAVLAHWLPFLFLSLPAGALADRFDPRRIIQLGMVLFMGVSVAWGWLFATDTLEMWHAMVLLALHGIAGVLWSPASQLLIHDIVGPGHLQSAVRLNATARWLGMLLGPGLGGGMLLVLGAAHAIFLNALIYLPIIVWLWRAPYGPKFRVGEAVAAPALRGFRDVLSTFRSVAHDRTIVPMTLLAGGASLLIGNAYQAQMPGFAEDLGHGDPGLAYSTLLAADAAGALIAGFVLESRGLLRPSPRTAFLLAIVWSIALAGFALTDLYALALALLFVAGFVELSFSAMAQTLVQLSAPAAMRGRVIGLYTTASLGLRSFSGISVGLVGGVVGIHISLGLSAALMLATACVLLVRHGPQGRATRPVIAVTPTATSRQAAQPFRGGVQGCDNEPASPPAPGQRAVTDVRRPIQ